MLIIFLLIFFFVVGLSVADEPQQVSGIYPHLAMFNDEAECGTGAVVPWADRLWVITYGPHLPLGSTDKLYEITPDLEQIIRPESVGGTHANRLIHKESEQLFIGLHAIDKNRNVRTISPQNMPGRQTGNARHLTDPETKIYYATMEEGLYEIDVNTFEVVGLIKDGNDNNKTSEPHPATISSKLPGYHGKGVYMGQGRVVYSNNGDQGPRVMFDPTVDSGALAQWTGIGNNGDWQLIRRNQFTEVSGPGGIYGNENSETDPIWSVGWDYRSVILMLLDGGKWTAYRLPKASHTYDGAHGWHTEWPRIRDIGDDSLLMTMHGTFWKFPKSFSSGNSKGIVPRSTYLKVVGDFCNWNGKVVFGCDDTAKSEFTNRRKVKGELAGPGRSQSNLWFVEPSQLDSFGPKIGRGGPWINETVIANEYSEPYLFNGYENRMLHFSCSTGDSNSITIEVDENGNGNWKELKTISIKNGKGFVEIFPKEQAGIWIRMKTDKTADRVTAMFHYRGIDNRSEKPAAKFAGIAKINETQINGGVLHARGADFKTLRFIAQSENEQLGVYDLDAELKLTKKNDPDGLKWTSQNAAIPVGVLEIDAASVLLVDEKGRWRLPKGDILRDKDSPLGSERVCREVATERDLFHAHGTFYELPAENSGGIQKIRPIASHPFLIKDYASYRGMLVISGMSATASTKNPHIVKSDDSKCSLWCGVIDDLWDLGKPRGIGGPWNETEVKANEPSDPYLMSGYDKKRAEFSHKNAEPVVFRIELDICGDGRWTPWHEIEVQPGQTGKLDIPVDAYWGRVVSEKNTTTTAVFYYE